ncbi:MAG: tRNA (N6-isopentenyl adenosine(37)-C2)-methylthiotransferase MiaB [Candidatus Aminicenantes bacterium]|nr:tRNA (N6-isopentenyl adenosine(37)-C2)-methylthiotransferase MiaB [Candidatus Aminicenantes bacterium]
MEKSTRNLKNLKFYVHTFGCQMNENDSERIAGILSTAGGKISSSPEESDIIIVNTCAVRKKSEEKLYSYLGRLASSKKKKKRTIGVVGCVAQLYGPELLEKKSFIDFVLGPDNYNLITEIIQSNHEEKFASTSWSREYKEIPHEKIFRESNISAYVTIMEGCNNFCSYCIVPFTRGREKCRPLQKITQEIQNLANKGYKEIQLLGQNVNSYKDPETEKDFSVLLKEANRIIAIEWIRFITSHPKNFTKNIAETMKGSEKVCHQLHLPVQSGSSSVLKRMNRGYTREEYLEKITFLRDLMPDISLSTDIIVGFPGETEKEFKETLSILEEVRFNNIFSFRYSPRPFTGAYKEKDNVSFEEKKRRLIEVQNLQKKIQLELNESTIGKVMKVLCTGKSKKAPRIYSGRNEGYQVVNFKSKNDVIGCFVDVHITSCGPYSLHGEATKQ